MVLEVVEETTIPLEQEIELCRLHLQVMSLRLNKDLRLETQYLTANEQHYIPPLVLHTLVENGVTHGYRGRKSGCFFVRSRQHGDKLIISFFNDGALQSGSASKGTGIGLRYVRSRLNEAYGSHWKLRSFITGKGWKIIVQLPINKEK